MTSLKMCAYNLIKEKILSCEYPPNSFINEHEIMNELDTSRTPIREALSMLEQEGFVTIIPKKGVLVKGLTLKTVNQLFEARLLFEPFIIEKYMEYIDIDMLQEIRKKTITAIHTEPTAKPEVFAQLDDRFHRLIVATCRNDYFIDMLNFTSDQNQRIRILTKMDLLKRHIVAAKEHISIIDDILKGDVISASAKMRQHLESAQKTALLNLGHRDFSFQ